MNKILLTITAGLLSLFSFGQNIDKIINAQEVERIEKILSADDMQGRKTFTPGIDKAAEFIAAEFAKSKLKYFGDAKNYFQEITMIKAKPVDISGMLGTDSLTMKNVAANTTAGAVECGERYESDLGEPLGRLGHRLANAPLPGLESVAEFPGAHVQRPAAAIDARQRQQRAGIRQLAHQRQRIDLGLHRHEAGDDQAGRHRNRQPARGDGCGG